MMKSRISKTFYSLFQLKPILLGIAIFNFITTYVDTERAKNYSYCLGAPWYLFTKFGYFPLYILTAVLGLYVRKWWSVIIAALLSAVIIEQFIDYHIRLANPPATTGFKFEFETLQDQLLYQSGLTFQFVFAVTILILASLFFLKRVLEVKFSGK